MILSFNNHYPTKADYNYGGNLPIHPKKCLKAVFHWMKSLDLPKNQVHTLVMPGVREALILVAYHTLMGHFPKTLHGMRDGGSGDYVWKETDLQDWRHKMRGRR